MISKLEIDILELTSHAKKVITDEYVRLSLSFNK